MYIAGDFIFEMSLTISKYISIFFSFLYSILWFLHYLITVMISLNDTRYLLLNDETTTKFCRSFEVNFKDNIYICTHIYSMRYVVFCSTRIYPSLYQLLVCILIESVIFQNDKMVQEGFKVSQRIKVLHLKIIW